MAWHTSLHLLIKVLITFFVRPRLADQLKATPVVVTSVKAGLCHSSLRREFTGIRRLFVDILERFFARTTKEGGRMLTFAAVGSAENPSDKLRGAYINLDQVDDPGDHADIAMFFLERFG
ncbi:hypothetical protein D9611_012668 [Ephemerocybe angulata]|uniref:Uncharacterized protein n=1 Tax=Ephemerocybe angulata TaxID=980116 RepID=A0A8H5B9C5_9AGAR|nr:hypothetical protein D9611_012668 [Tulosesus angulatus]